MLNLYQNLAPDDKRELATDAGTTVEYLSHIAYGHRKASPALALDIVRATHGQITPHDLRPDLYPDPDWLPVDVRNKDEVA